MGLDELGRLVEQVEELGEVLAEDEQAGLADFPGGVVALALGDHEEVVAVIRFLHLDGIGARAHRLEKLLEEDLLLGGGGGVARLCVGFGWGGGRRRRGTTGSERRGRWSLL